MAGSSRRPTADENVRDENIREETVQDEAVRDEGVRDEAGAPEVASPEAARAEAVSARALGGTVPGTDGEPLRWEETVGNRLSQVLVWLTGLLMVTAVVVIVIEIIYRYLLREPFESSQDIQGILFTWIVFLSLPRARAGRGPGRADRGHVRLLRGAGALVLEAGTVGVGDQDRQPEHHPERQ